MRSLAYLCRSLLDDPVRFAGVWNLIVTTAQLFLTILLAIFFGSNL